MKKKIKAINKKGDFMLSASSVYELKRMGIGLLICSAVSAVIFSIVLGYQNSILFGTLLGFAVAFLNYFFLCGVYRAQCQKEEKRGIERYGRRIFFKNGVYCAYDLFCD